MVVPNIDLQRCLVCMHDIIVRMNTFLVYIIGWDADYATTAYRQHVEALAQHQVCWMNLFLFFSPFWNDY